MEEEKEEKIIMVLSRELWRYILTHGVSEETFRRHLFNNNYTKEEKKECD